MTETHIDILRIVADHKSIKQRAIVEMLGIDPRGYLRTMADQKLVERKHSAGVSAYTIAPKGARLLATLDKGMGEIAAPRQMVSTEPYRGEKWTTRQGSEPEASYRRPMLISSGVMPSKGVA